MSVEHLQPVVRYVAYYRVSTRQQGQSGLGLQAQKAQVLAFVGRGEVLRSFVEIESGKRNDRPQLNEVVAYARKQKARLVIAKLDWLSRNAGFIFTLKNSGVDFVCCDMPDANTLTIGIFASLVQHEREVIGERTRRALAAKKAQGHTLGKPENLTEEARGKGPLAMQAKAAANENNRRVLMTLGSMLHQGRRSSRWPTSSTRPVSVPLGAGSFSAPRSSG